MNTHHREPLPTIIGVTAVLLLCVIVASGFRLMFPDYEPGGWDRVRPQLGVAHEIKPRSPTNLKELGKAVTQ